MPVNNEWVNLEIKENKWKQTRMKTQQSKPRDIATVDLREKVIGMQAASRSTQN